MLIIPPRLVNLFCDNVVNEQLVGSSKVLKIQLFTFVSFVMHTKRQERRRCKELNWGFPKKILN